MKNWIINKMKSYCDRKNINTCALFCLLSLFVLFQSREALSDNNVFKEPISKESLSDDDVSKELISKESLPDDNVFKELINKESLSDDNVLKELIGKEALPDNNVYRELIERGVATYEDGCRAISAYVGIEADTMTFEKVVLALKQKEIVDKRWEYAPDKTLTRAIMAYMIFKVLDMKGGFTMHVADGIGRFTSFVCRKLGISDDFTVPDIGIGRRYAFLEFQFQGIIPRGNKRTFLTGHDLMAIMYRLEQYIKGEEAKKKQEEKKPENTNG